MRFLASVLLCIALSTPVFAAAASRPAPNSRSDDSPMTRVITRVIKAVKHLLPVQPLDDADAGLTWPKP